MTVSGKPMLDAAAREMIAAAWNPGLTSSIPSRLQPAVTLFRPENAFLSYREANELSDLCGLKPLDLVSLRPQRLVVHELLIRVTADLSVPDGPTYEVLGLNLRSMVATLLERHVEPEMARVVEAWEAEKVAARAWIDEELSMRIFNREEATAESTTPGLVARLLGRKPKAKPGPARPSTLPELAALEEWQALLGSSDSGFERAGLSALIDVVGGMVGHRGRLLGDRSLIATLATNRVCNEHGAEVVAAVVGPLFDRAVAAEGYRVLPAREKPVIMNVKGASASGKSTIRPQQRELAGELGIPWEDFALISPDYWRKFLLDYSSLGEYYKYGAMLTGQELEIIDRKLDRYMAGKAARGAMSHLLIDRFRFDSFTLDEGRSADSRLLSRFGDRVFMFFMITPPHETVVRAWKRGLSTGRYKAVDDLLHHNVEAFTGMPALFLSWVHSDDKQVHFEFLDNDVPEGELPRTAAFGWNDSMTILDLGAMLNIDRFRKVDIEARAPEEILAAEELEATRNTGFLERCLAKVREVRFADRDSAIVYACVLDGKLVFRDDAHIATRHDAAELERVFDTLGLGRLPDACAAEATCSVSARSIDVEKERHFTLGRWCADWP